MHILGIDLATRRYSDIGVALLHQSASAIHVNFLHPAAAGLGGPPQVAMLAEWVADVARQHDVAIIAIDGPQAWKAPDNGLDHARLCEQLLRTQAKTGLPGAVKPGPALRFVRFAIDFFDALAEAGWPRLADAATLPPHSPVTVEVFPTAVWRALGLRPLPAKGKSSVSDIGCWRRQVAERFSLCFRTAPGHDELQALMAGLVALALASGQRDEVALYGAPPYFGGGVWREGYIANFVHPAARESASLKLEPIDRGLSGLG
jgi:hypothetical protein